MANLESNFSFLSSMLSLMQKGHLGFVRRSEDEGGGVYACLSESLYRTCRTDIRTSRGWKTRLFCRVLLTGEERRAARRRLSLLKAVRLTLNFIGGAAGDSLMHVCPDEKMNFVVLAPEGGIIYAGWQKDGQVRMRGVIEDRKEADDGQDD